MRHNPFARSTSPEIEQEILKKFREVSQQGKGHDWSDDLWVAYSMVLEKFPNKSKEVMDAYTKVSGEIMEVRNNPRIIDEYRGVTVDVMTGKEERL